MSSYTKTMMAAAKTWLDVNPDKDDPFLRVPQFEAIREKTAIDQAAAEGVIRKAISALGLGKPLVGPSDESVRKGAELDASLKHLGEAHLARGATAIELEASMQTVEGMLNKNYNGVSSMKIEDEILGRFLLAWARDGYNVFELSPDFVAAMLLTDSREIDIARTRLPFKGLLVLLPDGFARDAQGRSYTKVHLHEVSEREAAMLGAAEAVDKELGKLPREVLDAATRDASSTPAWINNSPSKLLEPWQGARLAMHASCGPWGFNFIAKRDGLSWDSIEESNAEAMHQEDIGVIHTIQMLVFSMLAYINAVKGSVEAAEASKPKRKARGVGTFPKRWTVGRTIKIDPRLVQIARAGRSEIAFRLKHRHMVRGHFKQQVYGPNRTLRKEIYVDAYWKGPEDGAALVHTYKPVSHL